MLDSVIATCSKMIASYDKHMSATTPTPLRVETLAAMEKAEIAIPPVAPAPPPSQAEALVEFVEDEEEDVVGAKLVQPLSLSSFPLAAPTSVSQPLPLQFKTLTAMEATKINPQPSFVAPLVIAPLLSMPTAVVAVDIAPLPPQIENLVSSPIASPVHTADLPSIVIEMESQLEPTAITAPFSPSLDVKHRHVEKLQTLLVKGRPRQINGYVLSLGIRITTRCVIYNRGRRILGQINPWRFRKKRETSLGMFGVDSYFLYWWKKRKKKRKKDIGEEDKRVGVGHVEGLPANFLHKKFYYGTLLKKAYDEELEDAAVDDQRNMGLGRLSRIQGMAQPKKSKKESTKLANGVVVEKGDEAPQAVVLPETQIFKSKKMKLAESVFVGLALQADPEVNISYLKEIIQLCKDHDSTIVKLSLLSLLAVYKSIIHGYHTWLRTAKELGVKIFKEVKQMWSYDSTQLFTYNRNLQRKSPFPWMLLGSCLPFSMIVSINSALRTRPFLRGW
ncbi:unnamed protein product [Linum trigynum]|uniref:Nucleolar complex-associated protein 3 N-terminal domain-containing protein n=1 Tax=Linum trigynum TaxID=586398 RepID=A0AAV2EB86_9ROSI